MLGHRSWANLLATSLPHCVRTTPLSSPFLPPGVKINCTHPSLPYLAGVCVCFFFFNKVRTWRLFRFLRLLWLAFVCCLVGSGDRTFGSSFCYTCYSNRHGTPVGTGTSSCVRDGFFKHSFEPDPRERLLCHLLCLLCSFVGQLA